MRAEDQAIFGAIFGEVVDNLLPGWEMSVGTMANNEPNVRYRAMASNNRTDDMLVVYGATELAAISRLRETLAKYPAR